MFFNDVSTYLLEKNKVFLHNETLGYDEVIFMP